MIIISSSDCGEKREEHGTHAEAREDRNRAHGGDAAASERTEFRFLERRTFGEFQKSRAWYCAHNQYFKMPMSMRAAGRWRDMLPQPLLVKGKEDGSCARVRGARSDRGAG